MGGPEPPGNPLGALRAKASQLRRALDEAEAGARELIVTRSPGYLVGGDTDARRFREAAGRAGAAGDPRERAAPAGRGAVVVARPGLRRLSPANRSCGGPRPGWRSSG
ncbi:hypothetical protein ACFSTC_28585 [Nonomuraea ferruginea]